MKETFVIDRLLKVVIVGGIVVVTMKIWYLLLHQFWQLK